MSGTALTTVSPSSVRMRRNVVWVAGCCGPKLSVHRYSFSGASSRGVCKSRGMLALRPRQHRKIMPFAAAAERVILAQWKARVFIRHENAAQVRMAGETDAVHVINFALHP